MSYMNVTEIESALIGLAAAHGSICELITLPHLTIEGRTSHAVRLGTQAAGTVDAVYLTGGVHAREWGSSDILVNLAADLCGAYLSGMGVGYGAKYFSAAEVKAIMEQLNVFIFPCVNPDGRAYSQAAPSQALWRKNRNPASSGGSASRVGVDINRNQDAAWDFVTAFAPAAQGPYLASSDPSSDTFHGTGPASEPETKNINHIHDSYPGIKWYVDVHSYSEDILYVSGFDEVQSSDPNQTFLNPAYDHQRGLPALDYKEYVPEPDLASAITLSNAFTRTLAEVRGTYYVAKPAFSLYATSGTNDDYAYCRHQINPLWTKTLGFTVEWGTDFQPPWAEMQEIIKDVSAGLLGIGLEALGVDSFIVANRDTFSRAEVETTAAFDEALYVMYDGFSPMALGLPGALPALSVHDETGALVPSIAVTAYATTLEDPAALTTPQRVTFTCRVNFTDTSAFSGELRRLVVHASFAGNTDVAPLTLLDQPNPYMVDGPVNWLSTDVRVFQLRPGQAVTASSTVLADPNSSPNAGSTYIKAFLQELRGFGNGTAAAFESLAQDQEGSRLELARSVGGVRVLNFAVAKVRYRANTMDATDVRVFFRTFNTMVSDLTYTSSTTAQMRNYRRTPDGHTPLLGLNAFFSGAGNQIVSVPYFAEPRIDSSTTSMTAQPDDANRVTLQHAGGTEAVAYFGCWLDFNQTEPQFPVNPSSDPALTDGPYSGPRVPIMQLVRGIHQCLVAEVRFQPGTSDPISNGATPASSDRLAQRNLAIVDSDNPGPEDSHRVQHTFLITPSHARKEENQPRSHNDELVLRWNDLPPESTATLYLPGWNANEVLSLASTLRPGPRQLTKIDAHTIGLPIDDITFVPLPGRLRSPLPGLLTIQLPPHVKEGQRFTVDIQQHAGIPASPSTTASRPATLDAREVRDGDRQRLAPVPLGAGRRVLGAFRVEVAVGAGHGLVRRLVRNLAALRYIARGIPVHDDWHPVFERYVHQLGAQLEGLGIDASRVPASADDPGLPTHLGKEEGPCPVGRVSEILFDCFGRMEGFILQGCCEARHIRCNEPNLERLIVQSLRERLTLQVCLCPDGRRIKDIRVLGAP